VAIGSTVLPALAAAQLLAQDGHELAVYDARFAKPLDSRLLREAAALPFLVTIEENSVRGGFGAAVLEFLAEEEALDQGLRLRTWGLPDQFIPHGCQSELRSECALDAMGLVNRLRPLLHR
jgi:1-deoxy-D-xylulose-5-phosphate synthase